jgi:hypothetical protein
MWIVFDQIWANPASQEMVRIFKGSVRAIATLADPVAGEDSASQLKRIRGLRTSINSSFLGVSAQADAIPFEFGRRRMRHMIARAHIRRWQPPLRTLYLILVAITQYRLFGADSDLPPALLEAQDRFNCECARVLNQIAGRLEGNAPTTDVAELHAALHHLEEQVEEAARGASSAVSARVEGLLTLVRQGSPILEDLFRDVMRTPATAFIKL